MKKCKNIKKIKKYEKPKIFSDKVAKETPVAFLACTQCALNCTVPSDPPSAGIGWT
ncbi:MAG: hypothetical protein PHQ54_02025 [Candidatus Omnitrophica bacterium]|nr:hypothetical protein [Candidatus Omnitrophota bacterium]